MTDFCGEKLSVIVPIYNVEEYLDECIKSIVNQTYKNLEIILVDDGSPDHCPELCDIWAEKDSRIKVIHKENGGVSSARNAGLDAAAGDFIAFVDSDDYLDSDMYEIMLTQMREHNADMAQCGIVRENADGSVEVWDSFKAPIVVMDNMKLLCSVGEAAGILPVHCANKIFTRKVVENVRFDTRFKYAEDTLFNFAAARNINKAVIQNVPRYHYVNNSDSASHQEFSSSRFDEHKVMDIIFDMAANDNHVLQYCIKGDVLKSFRTIRQMIASNSCTDKFKIIRQRIIRHRKAIFSSGLYSKATKLKTLLLWLMPGIYKILIKIYNNKD